VYSILDANIGQPNQATENMSGYDYHAIGGGGQSLLGGQGGGRGGHGSFGPNLGHGYYGYGSTKY